MAINYPHPLFHIIIEPFFVPPIWGCLTLKPLAANPVKSLLHHEYIDVSSSKRHYGCAKYYYMVN